MAAEPLLTLRHGALRLELAPDIGGSIARCFSEQDGQRRHWLRPASAEALCQGLAEGMACFPLLPHGGRVRDGRYLGSDGQWHRLPDGTRHSLHGIGWRLPWQTESLGEHAARLTLTVDSGQWPFPFLAEQTITLDDSGFSHTLRLTLLGDAPLPHPCGLGLHPYFPRTPDCRIRLLTAGMWRTDDAVLPLQPTPATALRRHLQFGWSPDRRALDNTFYGWQRQADIDWGSHTLRLQADSRFVALYTPAEQDFFCLAPCTHVPDFANHADAPPAQRGGHWLRPGDTLALSCRYRWQIR